MLRLFLLCFSVAVAGLTSGGASAASVRGQNPCQASAGACVQFDQDDPIPVIRSFSLKVKTAGTYQVTFTGSMICRNASSTAAVVDLSSQIVFSGGADSAGPGGLRHAMVMDAAVVGKPAPQESFNLTSTRIVVANAANEIVSFAITRNRMDAGTRCSVSNDSFSAVFVGVLENNVISGGEPCATSNGNCGVFSQTNTVASPSIVVQADRKGSVLITANASLFCGNSGGAPQTMDIASQIVGLPDAEPRVQGPGGLRSMLVLPPGDLQASDSLSLASSRLFEIPAGQHDFFFRIKPLRMDSSSLCYIFNNAISAVFAPSSSKLDMRSQPPCTRRNTFCEQINGNRRLIARSFTLKTPSAGTARLDFRGSLVCLNINNAAYDVVVKGQIVTHRKPVPEPDPDGPGGMRQVQRLQLSPDLVSADTFNLATTRVFTVSKATSRSSITCWRSARAGACSAASSTTPPSRASSRAAVRRPRRDQADGRNCARRARIAGRRLVCSLYNLALSAVFIPEESRVDVSTPAGLRKRA